MNDLVLHIILPVVLLHADLPVTAIEGHYRKLVLDWHKRQQARAEVRMTIEKLQDQGLPRAYTPELFEQKTTAVFQHIYDAYYGAGRSVYATA